MENKKRKQPLVLKQIGIFSSCGKVLICIWEQASILEPYAENILLDNLLPIYPDLRKDFALDITSHKFCSYNFYIPTVQYIFLSSRADRYKCLGGKMLPSTFNIHTLPTLQLRWKSQNIYSCSCYHFELNIRAGRNSQEWSAVTCMGTYRSSGDHNGISLGESRPTHRPAPCRRQLLPSNSSSHRRSDCSTVPSDRLFRRDTIL
jgi:hypothetical protein